MTQFLTGLAGILLGCGATTFGLMLGRRMTLETINQEVVGLKAHLLIERDEVERISQGIRQGWIDSTGQEIKLLTSSKLRGMSLGELEGIAKDRGILMVMQLGDRGALIAAIENQQRQWQRARGEDWKIGLGAKVVEVED
jgi:hypothetical protein